MPAKKRYRVPRPKPGHLVVTWGKADRHALPSIVYVYPDRDGRCDARVLGDVLEGRRYLPDHQAAGGYRVERSLADELEARGYDLSTLRISITRKTAPVHAPQQGKKDSLLTHD